MKVTRTKKHSGFTLIELVITMAIIGILITVGVPNLKSFLQGNRLIAATNELVSALHIARSEAIKLNSRVSICPSTDGSTCTGGNNWADGWVVFVDADSNLLGTAAACVAINTDCLLRVHSGFGDDQLTVTGLDNIVNISSLTFSSRGLPIANIGADGAFQRAVFSLCRLDDGGATVDRRAVRLSLPGRARVSDNIAGTTCP